jgi:post-segregation antitoxin (ccd killing protein)
MRMARVNVYLPDEMAQQARAAGLNISKVTQAALSAALARNDTDRWLDRLERSPRVEVPHDSVIQAIDEARSELGEPGEPAST